MDKTQEERSAQAREQIIRAAFICLGERGYQNTTLSDIATKAGCSRELPRYHFGSRDGLISTLINESEAYWSECFREQAKNQASAIDALCNIVDQYTAPFTSDSPRLRGQAVLVFGAADPSNGKLRVQLSQAQRRLRGALMEIITRDPHITRADHNAHELATIIYGTLRGLMYQWLVDGEDFNGQAVIDEFKLLMRGMFSIVYTDS
jgi:AcrR family transcriptional regulator